MADQPKPATDEQIEPLRKLLEEPDCRVQISMHIEGLSDQGTETRDRLNQLIARIEAEKQEAEGWETQCDSLRDQLTIEKARADEAEQALRLGQDNWGRIAELERRLSVAERYIPDFARMNYAAAVRGEGGA